MAVQLLLAPPAGGKTACAIEAIRGLPPLSPVRVLLPDQVEVAAFRRRLAMAGGALGVEVQTFYGLYADVLTLAGCLSPPAKSAWGTARLLPAVRHRLIRHLTGTLYDAGQLPYYAPLRNSSGFARLLADLFGELKRARVLPQALESITTHSEARLAELARIYAAYQAWLIDTGWVDADGQGWLAALALEEKPTLLSELSLLVVDGFDEFNPTQLHMLHLLAGRAAATLVTLTGEPDRPHRLAHRRMARALAALRETFGADITASPTLPTPSPTPRPLSHLETHLFEPSSARCSAEGAVELLEAQNRAAEVREAMRWLKARLVRDGVSALDVALVARDVAPYRPFLEEVAAEFGLPLRFISGAELGSNPAIAALLRLLGLALEPDSWSPRVLLDVLSSPYFDWGGLGLQPGDADRLKDVARSGQVIAGLDQWREAFQRVAAGAPQEHTEIQLPGSFDEEYPPARRPLARADVARLEAVFTKIVERITPAPGATLRERVAWVEELIGEDPALAPRSAQRQPEASSLHIVACARKNLATAERDVAALRAFKDILRGLVLADSVLNPPSTIRQAVNYDQFIAELVQAIEGATYKTPVEGEAILAASALEVRGLTFECVALIGLAEGEFPRAEREDVLLHESDRAWLKERGVALESRLQGDEVTLFYQAVTRARRRLLLCRPYLADDGQAWEPSPYWSSVRDLFEDAPLTRVRPGDPVTDVASEQELVGATGGDKIQLATAVLQARSRSNRGLSAWRGDLSAVAAQLAERFGPDQPWSSSRLETFAKCPFYFWATYALELEPRELPQAGYDVLILGSIYHLVLERLYSRVPDGDPDRLRAELPAVAGEVYTAAPNDYGFRPTPLWERQQEELNGVLERTLEALIDAAGDYRPWLQELPFGLKDKPALVLHNGGPALQVRGYIDRVDRAPDGRLRVIDYKAGSTPISAGDLTDGHRLQLPLYALAAQQVLGAPVASAFYWHIGSAKPSSLRLEKYAGGIAGAIETAIGHALPIAAAVRDGRLAPTPPGEGCPAFCPAATFCELYKPRSW